uniref:Uncharacterized protein n=1 Tax=Oryza brachyantha TaxID=4533 RepID=J3LBL5_ORYBR
MTTADGWEERWLGGDPDSVTLSRDILGDIESLTSRAHMCLDILESGIARLLEMLLGDRKMGSLLDSGMAVGGCGSVLVLRVQWKRWLGGIGDDGATLKDGNDRHSGNITTAT